MSNNFQISKIPAHIVRDIAEYMVENGHAHDEQAAKATMHLYNERSLMDMFLNWNGLVNYTDVIIMALDGIRAAKNAAV